MVGSRLGQVRFGYVTFLCDRYGSTCDAKHTNTEIITYFKSGRHFDCVQR